MRRNLIGVACLVLLIVGAVPLWNHSSLQSRMNEVIASDPRNEGIGARVRFGGYIRPSILVFDLREVPGDKSPVDVFRALLQFAAAVKERRFESVQLAYRGDARFLLEGGYFATLGQEYETQNPVYTMRTFPEHVMLPSGEKAYDTWTGGWLGVTGQQLEDFNDFHQKWYISDLH